MTVLVLAIVGIETLLSGSIGMTVWKNKGGDPGGGFIFCAFLGTLGVLILVLGKPGQKEIARVARSQGLSPCPYCMELIKREARVCRYCGHDVAPAPAGVP